MSKYSPENLLLVGKVNRPHGLTGLLRIWSYARSETTLLNAGSVFLKPGLEDPYSYRVVSVRPHRSILLMQLEGINSLEEAERFRGSEILIRKDALHRERDDEYFWFELIGLSVFLNSGRYIGTLREILATRSNDIYVIREGSDEFLIPAIHDVVEEIDLGSRKMIVSEVEGLFDLNEV